MNSVRSQTLPVSDDMSGFDAVHTIQSLMATVDIDSQSVTSDAPLTKWTRANRRWVVACAHSYSAFGNNIYQKTTPGMINSGSKDTSRRNTLLRLLYSHYFCIKSNQPADFVVANGDDALTWGIVDQESYLNAAEEAGFTLRDFVQCDGQKLNFCSHTYDLKTKVASLSSWKKGIYKILLGKTPLQDGLQFSFETRHNVEFPKILKFINEACEKE